MMKPWDPIARRDREHRLACMPEIEDWARRLVLDAGVERVFPTPVAPIARVLGLEEEVWPTIDLIDSYASRLSLAEASALNSALQKTSGWKYGRRFSINPSAGPRQIRKAAFHEIGHETLVWHRVRGNLDLTTTGHDAFDLEANVLGSELIFQGSHFDAIASSMPIRRESVTRLADMYQAPWHDTLVRFVEHRREPVVLLISDGYSRRVVAAAGSALELGLEQDMNRLGTTLIESFNVGLRIVGARRYELVIVSHSAGLRLVA